MTARTPAAILAALAALATAGCGGSDSPATQATDGKTIFKDSGCGGCHVLSDAGADGKVGPNLDEAKPDVATVRNRVENGGGGMPSFGSQLSDAQITAVAEYVAKAAGR